MAVESKPVVIDRCALVINHLFCRPFINLRHCTPSAKRVYDGSTFMERIVRYLPGKVSLVGTDSVVNIVQLGDTMREFARVPHFWGVCEVIPCATSEDRLDLLFLSSEDGEVWTAHAVISSFWNRCTLLRMQWLLKESSPVFHQNQRPFVHAEGMKRPRSPP